VDPSFPDLASSHFTLYPHKECALKVCYPRLQGRIKILASLAPVDISYWRLLSHSRKLMAIHKQNACFRYPFLLDDWFHAELQ
jgi:hypothetical protein